MPATKNIHNYELTSSRFDELVKETLIAMGFPLIGMPEPDAKKARAAALEKLQVHRRCSFCGRLSNAPARRPGGPTTGSICQECQRSSERRKRFGCW